MLKSAEAQALTEIAKHEGVCSNPVRPTVKLTTRAPHIAVAILDDALPNHITLFEQQGACPGWDVQRQRLEVTQ